MDSKRLHSKLEQELKDHLTDDDIDSLKRKMIALGFKRGEVAKMKDFYNIFDALNRKGKISPGNYCILKQMFTDMEDDEAVQLVTQCEGSFKTLHINNADVSDAQPSSPVGMTGDPISPSFPRSNPLERCYTTGTGYVLIINQFVSGRKARKGTMKDEGDVRRFFEQRLHYECRCIRDVSWSEVRDELAQVQRHLVDNRSKYSCFICFIMSHGKKEGIQMYSHDDTEEYIPGNEIVSFFKSDQLPEFRGKPKVFVVQACRGAVENLGIPVSDYEATVMEEESDADVVIPTIPIDCDILLAYSTTDGYRAFRSADGGGSWFIQCLCGVLRSEHESEHLVDMLTEVNRRVAATEHSSAQQPAQSRRIVKQMSCIHSQLTRKLYLTPAPTTT